MSDQAQAKIIVADDDRDIRELLGATLKAEGYWVVLAADGVEALTLLPRERPDLVILDLNMPRLNGYEVLRRIRRSPRQASTRVLVVSATASREVGGWPVEGVLTKPFDLSQLLALVVRILDQDGSDRAASKVVHG